MWLVPWLTITATQVVKDSLGDTTALQPLAMANATNELTALSMSPEDIGLLINFGWSFFCIILAIFFEFLLDLSEEKIDVFDAGREQPCMHKQTLYTARVRLRAMRMC